MNENSELSDYDDYARWKMSVNDWGEFFELTESESEEIALQFSESKILLSNSKVLEVGFGSGKILRWLQDNGCLVEGIEIQENLLQLAKEKKFKVYQHIIDTEGPYDLIVGFDVLEHLTLEQLKDFFYHASKKLNPSGKMLFRFPNGDSYAGMAAQNGDYTHVTSIGKSKLRQIVEPYGFRIESFEGRIEYPVRVFRSLILKIIRWPLIKIIGFDNPYFFSGNVVAVIGHKNTDKTQ